MYHADKDLQDIFYSEGCSSELIDVFQSTFFAHADNYGDCAHTEIERWADGRGYCADCGTVFSDAGDNKSTISSCNHENTGRDEVGMIMCRDCGEELSNLDFSQEWRYYGFSDSRSSKDPSRCHKPKSNPKGVRSVFEENCVEVSPAIISIVEYKYNKVLETLDSKVLRGNGRKAIVAACLFFTYQEMGEYRTSLYIRRLFGVAQKTMSAGTTNYFKAFPADRVKSVTPEMLLPWLMKITGVDQTHYRRIMLITKYLTSTSRPLERSNPQSVAAAVIFFYLCLNPDYKSELNMTKAIFSKKARLSNITITKMVKEIAEISREAVTL